MVAVTAGATLTATGTTGHPGEMTMIAMPIGEIAAANAGPLGSWGTGGRDSRGYGPYTSNPRDRDRVITQMVEDEHYQHRKQYDPAFIGSGASASVPSSEGGKANENE